LLGMVIHYADQIHPFTPTVRTWLEAVESALFGFDVLLSGFVLIVGAIRFCKEICRG
jgi:hypothetical protein